MAGPRYSTTYKQLMGAGLPGIRIDYATYNTPKLQAQRAAFLIKEFLCNNLAASAYDGGVKLATPWVMQWSSDGTTGPATDADATDRITDHTKFATRVDSDTAPVSYYVLRSGVRLRAEWAAATAYNAGSVVTNGDHLYVCQIDGTSAAAGGPLTAAAGLIADGTTSWLWIGAGDGYARLLVSFRTAQDYLIAFSFSTKLARAATPTHRPQAAANSGHCLPGPTWGMWLTGSDVSGDRILHCTAHDDGAGFWIGAARADDVPTLGGAIVMGRIAEEYADGVGGSSALALPVFLWNAGIASLKNINTTLIESGIYAYGSATVGGVISGRETGVQGSVANCCLLAPIGFGNAATILPRFTTAHDSFLGRRRWPLGWAFQSMPLTHVCGTEVGAGAIIWGTSQDMHTGSPVGITTGLLFGKRWFCYGILLFPNPSQLEPVST